jgi:hypothetical protein
LVVSALAAGLRGEVTSAKIDSQIVAASNFVATIKFMYRALEILALICAFVAIGW